MLKFRKIIVSLPVIFGTGDGCGSGNNFRIRMNWKILFLQRRSWPNCVRWLLRYKLLYSVRWTILLLRMHLRNFLLRELSGMFLPVLFRENLCTQIRKKSPEISGVRMWMIWCSVLLWIITLMEIHRQPRILCWCSIMLWIKGMLMEAVWGQITISVILTGICLKPCGWWKIILSLKVVGMRRCN